MTPGARVAAAIEILGEILADSSAERALTAWARRSRFAGSKDRAAVRDHVFDVLRSKRSLAARAGVMTGRGLMMALLDRGGFELDALFDGQGHSPAPVTDEERMRLGQAEMSEAEACDIPDWLWHAWVESLGADAVTAAETLQSRAPVYLRVNRRRVDTAGAIAALAEDEVVAEAHPSVPDCLRITGNERKLKLSRAYLDGLVELQDAASQSAVLQVPVPNGGRVLDYCAGGGGKALAFADRYDCDVVAHDIDPTRMKDLPGRAARAQVVIDQRATDDLSPASFDVVFCDAPCSGSGTWRRAPDAKWRLTVERLAELHQIQVDVLCQAAALVRPGGQLVYATCSVLAAENESIVKQFCDMRPEWRVSGTNQWIPGAEWDGFYLCRLVT